MVKVYAELCLKIIMRIQPENDMLTIAYHTKTSFQDVYTTSNATAFPVLKRKWAKKIEDLSRIFLDHTHTTFSHFCFFFFLCCIYGCNQLAIYTPQKIIQ